MLSAGKGMWRKTGWAVADQGTRHESLFTKSAEMLKRENCGN